MAQGSVEWDRRIANHMIDAEAAAVNDGYSC